MWNNLVIHNWNCEKVGEINLKINNNIYIDYKIYLHVGGDL